MVIDLAQKNKARADRMNAKREAIKSQSGETTPAVASK